MGLDMYLSKRTYVGNHYREPQNRVEIILPENEGDELFPIKKGSIKTERISEIIEGVGYWRKANAIHQWFVDNVQDGEDDCGEYYVPREKIEELYKLCKKVVDKAELVEGDVVVGQTLENGEWKNETEKGLIIQNEDEIRDLLPTQSGFFFGSTEYDEWYLSYIKTTISILKPLLEEGGDFYYSSSW